MNARIMLGLGAAALVVGALVGWLAGRSAWAAALVGGAGTWLAGVLAARWGLRTMPVKSIYVGNLPYQAREGELRNIFERCGFVYRVRLIRDPKTRKSKGYAFIDMDPDGAARALEEMDGFMLQGRKLKVGRAERDA